MNICVTTSTPRATLISRPKQAPACVIAHSPIHRRLTRDSCTGCSIGFCAANSSAWVWSCWDEFGHNLMIMVLACHLLCVRPSAYILHIYVGISPPYEYTYRGVSPQPWLRYPKCCPLCRYIILALMITLLAGALSGVLTNWTLLLRAMHHCDSNVTPEVGIYLVYCFLAWVWWMIFGSAAATASVWWRKCGLGEKREKRGVVFICIRMFGIIQYTCLWMVCKYGDWGDCVDHYWPSRCPQVTDNPVFDSAAVVCECRAFFGIALSMELPW